MQTLCLSLKQLFVLFAFIFSAGFASALECVAHFVDADEKRPKLSSLGKTNILKHYEVTKLRQGKTVNYDEPEFFQDAINSIKTNLPELIRLSQGVIKAAGASSQLVIGIGGSPSPILSLIKELNPQQKTLNLPLSVPYLPSKVAHVGSLDSAQLKKRLSREQMEEVMATWSLFLPDAEDIPDRKVLLMDFASTGESLVYTAQLIEHFYARQGHDIQVNLFAFHEKKRSGTTPGLHALPIGNDGRTGWRYEMPAALAHLFLLHDLKPLSQYPSYVPLMTPVSELVTRSEYFLFRLQLRTLLAEQQDKPL